MVFIEFTDDKPDALSHHTIVKADDNDELNRKLRERCKVDYAHVLFIDSLDATNHKTNSYITIGNTEYKANTYYVGEIID